MTETAQPQEPKQEKQPEANDTVSKIINSVKEFATTAINNLRKLFGDSSKDEDNTKKS
ncbi:MAG: hypothetical protein WCW01_04780 [Gammaproteobacteria bacterium]